MNSRQRRKYYRKGNPKPILIKDWRELSLVPDSSTHKLEINVDGGNGWIYKKDGRQFMGRYLSTHTFYKSTHKRSTRLLRSCGFNITLDNWDKQ